MCLELGIFRIFRLKTECHMHIQSNPSILYNIFNIISYNLKKRVTLSNRFPSCSQNLFFPPSTISSSPVVQSFENPKFHSEIKLMISIIMDGSKSILKKIIPTRLVSLRYTGYIKNSLQCRNHFISNFFIKLSLMQNTV